MTLAKHFTAEYQAIAAQQLGYELVYAEIIACSKELQNGISISSLIPPYERS